MGLYEPEGRGRPLYGTRLAGPLAREVEVAHWAAPGSRLRAGAAAIELGQRADGGWAGKATLRKAKNRQSRLGRWASVRD
jgi:hypothetical protein